MITFLKTNFLTLLVVILVGLLLIDRCSQKKDVPIAPTIVRDTIWTEHTSTGNNIPSLINSIPYPIDRLTKEIQYLPDTNYHKLLIQYQNLLSLYLVKNIQQNKIKIDSIGFVFITDTVTKNLITGRKFSYDLKYPIITNTITLPPTLRNQIYIGGSLEGNKLNPINQLNAGFLLKNKRDQIYGVYGGIDKNINFNLGIQSYWKINLRRK